MVIQQEMGNEGFWRTGEQLPLRQGFYTDIEVTHSNPPSLDYVQIKNGEATLSSYERENQYTFSWEIDSVETKRYLDTHKRVSDSEAQERLKVFNGISSWIESKLEKKPDVLVARSIFANSKDPRI